MKIQLLVPLCALLLPLASPVQAQRPPRGGEGDGGFRRPRPSATRRLQRLWHDLDHLDEAKQPLSKAQAAKIVALVRPWTTKPTLSEANAQKLHTQIEAVLTSAQRNEIGGPPGFGPPARGPRGDGRGGDGRGPEGRRPGEDGPGDGPGGRRRGPGGPDGDGFGPPRDGRGGPDGDFGPPRGARPNPPTEAQRAAGRAFVDALNPFYPPTGYSSWKKLPTPLQQDVARHYRENRATLEALSRKAKG